MKTILSIISLLLLFSCGSSSFDEENHFVDQVENSKFNDFKKDFIDTLCMLNPLWASKVGFRHCDSLLLMPSELNRERKVTFANQTSSKLTNYDYSVLERSNQIDYYRIGTFANAMVFNIEQLKEWEWNPAYYQLNDDFNYILNDTTKPLDKRWSDISKKLEKVPEYYVQAKMNIYKPTKEHTVLAIDTLKSSLSIFDRALPDSLHKVDGMEFPTDSFNQKIQSAKMAINDYIGWLENDLLPNFDTNNTRDFRLGKEKYSTKFDLESQSMYKAKEVYDKAMQEKADVTEKMHLLADSLWQKYYGILKKPEDGRLELIKMLVDTISAEDDSVHANMNEDSGMLMEHLQDFVDDNDLMPDEFFPKEDLEAFSWKVNSSRSELKKLELLVDYITDLYYQRYSTKTLMKISDKSATVDGWSLYMLKMLVDKGFFGGDPEKWLVFYWEYLKKLSYPILDYSVHVYGMNKEEAIELLVNEIFVDKAKAEKYWKTITLDPVHSSNHFIGYYEIMDLRKEMKSKLGDDFDLEEFHQRFLSYGDIPIKYIRMQMME